MSAPAPKRRWFRWSLRTLFVVVTLVALLLVWVASERNRVNHRRAIRDEIHKAGGITWGMQGSKRYHAKRWPPSIWLAKMLGDQDSHTIAVPASTSRADCLRIRDAYPEAYIWIDNEVPMPGVWGRLFD